MDGERMTSKRSNSAKDIQIMATNKELRIEQASESLAIAQKMVDRFQSKTLTVMDLSRIQDAATQATQAASNLNQLIGLVLAEAIHAD
jgi:hypothetical protein